MNLNSFLEITKITKKIIGINDVILPPAQVLRLCDETSNQSTFWYRKTIGYSDQGHEINVYVGGSGKINVLMYGFPDPGEAIGANVILRIMKAFAKDAEKWNAIFCEICWHLIPCVNFDDQPHMGLELTQVFRNENMREFDWCTHNPRSDTKAFLKYVQEIRPLFTYAMHDEYHLWEHLPAYFGTTKLLSQKKYAELRDLFEYFDIELSDEKLDVRCPPGFLVVDMMEDYDDSTFAVLNQYGQVITCELPFELKYSSEKLMRMQVLVLLYFFCGHNV